MKAITFGSRMMPVLGALLSLSLLTIWPDVRVWRRLIVCCLVAGAGNVEAQDVDALNQLNRLRNLQSLILREFTDILSTDVLDGPLILSLASGMTYTTNANLARNEIAWDFYATNSAGLRWQHDFDRGVAFSSGLELTDFRYIRHSGLSMSFLDWAMGVAWGGTLAGLESEAYVSHTLEWTQQRSFQTQTLSSILAAGGSLSQEIFPRHEVTLAAELSATPYVSPSANAYGCASLFAGYDWTVVAGLTLEVSALGYETMYFTGDRDFTASFGGMVTLDIMPWLSLSVFASPTWNFSEAEEAGYRVVDMGVSLSGSWQF